MPLAERFVCVAQGIWRPNRGFAAQLAEAIYACRFEGNQDREPIDGFECGRDLSVPTVAAQRPLPHYHSGFVGIWNWRACHDGNVASFFGTTDPLLEPRLVANRSWHWQRNPCFGGKMFRCRSRQRCRQRSRSDFSRKIKRQIEQNSGRYFSIRRQVMGIDNDPAAISVAKSNARLNRIRGTSFELGDVHKWNPAQEPT